MESEGEGYLVLGDVERKCTTGQDGGDERVLGVGESSVSFTKVQSLSPEINGL